MGDSLDALLQKLVLDARQRESDTRIAAAPRIKVDQRCIDALQDAERSADGTEVGVCSEQGARDTQEDRFSVIPDLCRLFPLVARKIGYFAVFDGHEGAACAEFARNYLHSNVVNCPLFPEDIPASLRHAFLSLDEAFLGPTEPGRDPLQLQYTAGSTAVCALVDWEQRHVHCAHVGDSRALLIKRDGSVRPLTEDHTGRSLSPEQREEIKRSGVAMVIGNYIWITTGGDSQRINRHSVSLEVSRAFGDPLFKHRYNPLLASHGRDIVSSTPDVVSVPLEDNDAFLLLATDGLFKAVSNERAAELVVKNADGDLNDVSRVLCREAIDARCGDNTTVVLIRLQQ